MQSTTKVYRIHSTLGNCCYVGITRNQYLSRRWHQHLYDYRRGHCYCSSHRVLCYPDAEIELLTEVPTADALREEARYINEYDNSTNIMKKRNFRIQDN